MRLARPVGIAVLAGAVVAGFALDSVAVRPTTARLVTIPSPIQPLISTRESLSTTWYCPGVPASGASGETGSFTLANLTDSPVDASVTVVPVGGASVRKVVALGQRGRIELVAADIAPGAVAAAMIEVAGGSIAVEQTSVTPAGSSVAACTTEPSDLWLFADGSTPLGCIAQHSALQPISSGSHCGFGLRRRGRTSNFQKIRRSRGASSISCQN